MLQMTFTKVMDVFARLSGCAEQAVDAVSAYVQVKMEDASTLSKISKSERSDIWIRLSKKQMFKITITFSVRVIKGTTIRKSSIKTRMGKSSRFGVFICKSRKRTILV